MQLGPSNKQTTSLQILKKIEANRKSDLRFRVVELYCKKQRLAQNKDRAEWEVNRVDADNSLRYSIDCLLICTRKMEYISSNLYPSKYSLKSHFSFNIVLSSRVRLQEVLILKF